MIAFKQWRYYLEGSRYTIEVLTDYNNLRRFMGVTKLNGRQARWAIQLAAYNFDIKHQPGKSNPADVLSRRPDYDRVSISKSTLLPTLQRKLAVLDEVFPSPKWQESLDTEVASVLVGLREARPRIEFLGSSCGETPTGQVYDIADEPLNPIAGTTGCK